MDANQKKLKIAIIGPVAPLRGGVAQYTTSLFLALKKNADVDILSFKRLYPNFLYPGSSDKDKEIEKVPGDENNIEYLIDAYSPLSIKKAADKILSGGYDAVLIDWWTFFWQPALAYIAFRAKRKRIKTIYICHNVFGHNSNLIIRFISKKLIKKSDGYIVQSNEEADLLRNAVPQAKILLKLHPIYDHFPKAIKNSKKKGRLELLFYGFIRPYKGLTDFVDALGILNDKEIYVSIVGEIWGDRKKIEEYINKKHIPNLTTEFNYVSLKAVKYFSKADVVVLPYRSATGSGVAALAYYYEKPILGTNVGGISDVVENGKTGWLVSPNSPSELAEAIRKIDRDQARKMVANISKFCKRNSWDQMAEDVIDFINKL